MLRELGADVFLSEFHKNAPTEQIRGQLDAIMSQIINDAPMAGGQPFA